MHIEVVAEAEIEVTPNEFVVEIVIDRVPQRVRSVLSLKQR